MQLVVAVTMMIICCSLPAIEGCEAASCTVDFRRSEKESVTDDNAASTSLFQRKIEARQKVYHVSGQLSMDIDDEGNASAGLIQLSLSDHEVGMGSNLVEAGMGSNLVDHEAGELSRPRQMNQTLSQESSPLHPPSPQAELHNVSVLTTLPSILQLSDQPKAARDPFLEERPTSGFSTVGGVSLATAIPGTLRTTIQTSIMSTLPPRRIEGPIITEAFPFAIASASNVSQDVAMTSDAPLQGIANVTHDIMTVSDTQLHTISQTPLADAEGAHTKSLYAAQEGQGMNEILRLNETKPNSWQKAKSPDKSENSGMPGELLFLCFIGILVALYYYNPLWNQPPESDPYAPSAIERFIMLMDGAEVRVHAFFGTQPPDSGGDTGMTVSSEMDFSDLEVRSVSVGSVHIVGASLEDRRYAEEDRAMVEARIELLRRATQSPESGTTPTGMGDTSGLGSSGDNQSAQAVPTSTDTGSSTGPTDDHSNSGISPDPETSSVGVGSSGGVATSGQEDTSSTGGFEKASGDDQSSGISVGARDSSSNDDIASSSGKSIKDESDGSSSTGRASSTSTTETREMATQSDPLFVFLRVDRQEMESALLTRNVDATRLDELKMQQDALVKVRKQAAQELKELQVVQHAREPILNRLQEVRTDAMVKTTAYKMDETQARVTEQQAESQFKRLPVKARNEAYTKIGESGWNASTWTARLAHAEEAMEALSRSDKAKRKKKVDEHYLEKTRPLKIMEPLKE